MIGQTSFNKLQPFFVKTLKDRAVCCCKLYMETIILKEGLNAIRLSRLLHHHDNICEYAVCDPYEEDVDDRGCTANQMTYKSITPL